MVLEVRDGFVRVWREDCRTPEPWGFRVDEETADIVKGKVRPGVAALKKLARRGWPIEKEHRGGMRYQWWYEKRQTRKAWTNSRKTA